MELNLRKNQDNKTFLTPAMRRSVLAKCNMLVSQFVVILNQTKFTTDLLEEMTEDEVMDSLGDIKCDVLNLTTIEQKIYSICNYAYEMKYHKLPDHHFQKLTASRRTTLLYLTGNDANNHGDHLLAGNEIERLLHLFPNQSSAVCSKDERNSSRHCKSMQQTISDIESIKILLCQATVDHAHLLNELTTINGCFFGINEKRFLKPLQYAQPKLECHSIEKRTPKATLSVTNYEGNFEDEINYNKSQTGLVVTKSMPGVRVIGNSSNWYMRRRVPEDSWNQESVSCESGGHDLSTLKWMNRTPGNPSVSKYLQKNVPFLPAFKRRNANQQMPIEAKSSTFPVAVSESAVLNRN